MYYRSGTAVADTFSSWFRVFNADMRQASANQAAVTAQTQDTLTDSTTGTANTTLQDVGAAFSQATLNNNFADIAAQLAKIKVDVAAIKVLQDQTRADLLAWEIQKGSA